LVQSEPSDTRRATRLERPISLWHSRFVEIALSFLFGLMVGSFLNVCILRIPAEMSIVSPRSRCPMCKSPIKPYDNIPVLSWVILGGRCRNCKARISALYPFVELSTAFLFIACYAAFGLTPVGLKWAVFSCLILVLTITDLRVRLLPDAVTFTGFGLGLAFSTGTPPIDGAGQWLWGRLFHFIPPMAALSLSNALLGAAFGGFLLWFVGEAYFKIRGKEGMGLGDAKMMLMVGSFFGLTRTFLTILVGSLLGTAVGVLAVPLLYVLGWKRSLARRASRRGLGEESKLRLYLAYNYQFPFGTYLGAAALLVVFFGSSVLEWYYSLLPNR
jgi:leader peptidase (prepilin peptidase)/N-methyltransferase